VLGRKKDPTVRRENVGKLFISPRENSPLAQIKVGLKRVGRQWVIAGLEGGPSREARSGWWKGT